MKPDARGQTRCLRRERSGFWMGGAIPPTDDPGEAEQTCPRVCGSTADGMTQAAAGASDVFEVGRKFGLVINVGAGKLIGRKAFHASKIYAAKVAVF